jgi:hypothetical protein
MLRTMNLERRMLLRLRIKASIVWGVQPKPFELLGFQMLPGISS